MKSRPLLQRLSYWVPVVLYAGFIYYLSSRENLQLPELFPYADKVLHAALYFALGFLTLRALACSSGMITRHSLLLAVLIASFYGATDEWHQYFIPGRQPDAFDLLADIIGSIIGSVGYLMLNDWMLRRMACSSRGLHH